MLRSNISRMIKPASTLFRLETLKSLNCPVWRNFSSASNLNKNSASIALSKDGTILCWHPEEEFPYEHSKPLPINQEEAEMGDSVMKIQYLNTPRNPDGPTKIELKKMFFTTRHPWDPKPFKRYEHPIAPPPPDREGL